MSMFTITITSTVFSVWNYSILKCMLQSVLISLTPSTQISYKDTRSNAKLTCRFSTQKIARPEPLTAYRTGKIQWR
jgi:hypothetical protein